MKLLLFSLFTFIFSLVSIADTYTLRGTRFLRKYTAPQTTQVYLAETDAQRIANSLCDVPWQESHIADATASSHVTTNLDANVSNRENFDAAIFCARHVGDEHIAYANAAVYRFEFPSSASLPSVTNLALNVYSDPYNAYGARICLMASNSEAIPTDCATVRGDAPGGIRAANVARRITRTSGGKDYWYPATTNLVFAKGGLLPAAGLALKRYLYVFVLMENYATSRGNWLEGCSYIDNAVKIMTDAPVPGWGATVGGCDIAEPYATRYHLKDGNADKDFDGDGLSNYAEYLISEVFQFARLDPDNPKSDDSCVDFFRKKGDLYLGELFMGYKDPGVPTLGLAEPLKLRLRYSEKRRVKAPVVVHAWNVATDPDMSGYPDRVFRAAALRVNGEHDLEAATVPDAGLETVLKGRVRFVAFADEDGDGAFEPGEPFAYWEGDAGHCRHAVALSDASPVFPRLALSGGDVAVTRVASADVTAGTVLTRRFATRRYLHEGDFLADGYDADWNGLAGATVAGHSPTSVTYRVVSGGETQTVVKPFAATAQAATIDVTQPGVVFGACPTFRWNAADGYTAFRLQIRSGGNAAYDSGYRVAPPRDADGRYGWTLDEPLGTYVRTGSNYSWRVSMYSARFKADGYSSDGSLVVNLNNQQGVNDHGHSSIAASVKYAGPDCIMGYADTKITSNTDSSKLRGLVRLQAYTTADFSGDPVGESFVRGKREVQNTAHSVSNACIRGLPQNGTYYVRAYIDLNGNVKKDDFEPWGAASEPVTLTTDVLTVPTVGIYIEDTDSDGDWIPDAYEFVQAGWSRSWDVAKNTLNGTIIGNDTIRFSSNVDTAGVSDGIRGASLTMFQNNDKLGGSYIVETLGLSASTETLATIRAEVAKNLEPNAAHVTGVSLSSNGRKATVHFADNVTDTVAGKLLDATYDLGTRWSTGSVTVKVYGKATLATASWTEIGTYTSSAFDRGDDFVDVTLGSGLNMTNGYYKVEVVNVQ